MGIELHPKFISLTARRRYRRSKNQLVLFGSILCTLCRNPHFYWGLQ